MRPPVTLLADLEEQFGNLKAVRAVSGGDINHAIHIELQNGESIFVKWIRDAPDNFLRSEADGLDALRQLTSLVVPEVLATGFAESGLQYLVMEYLDPAEPDRKFWENLGHGLAEMHQLRGDAFGWNHDNYIGHLHQKNGVAESWASFFEEQRLLPQLDLGLRNGVFGAAFAKHIHRICRTLPRRFPDTPPSPMHGDLWSGNILPTSRGPALIDPAFAYGNGEADIALSLLFGGFNADFYTAYNHTNPPEPGFASRVPIYQLYWLMVHANMFGGGYIRECMHIATEIP